MAVIALCVVVLLAAAYFGFRPRPPRADSDASPVVARPPADKRRREPPSARAGDAAVQAPAIADRDDPSAGAFRRFRQCFYASRELKTAKSLADCKFYEGKPEYQEAYAQCLNGWRNAPNRIAAAESALSECKDVGDIDRRYFEATREAAQKGDADAQLCYLQAEFGQSNGRPTLTDADIEEYKKAAPAYVDAAFKGGDWRMVYLLARRHFHPGMGPVTLLEGIGQPETLYKMTSLLRLGASGPYAKGLDADLNDMRHPARPENALPQDTIKEADAWANQTYVNYFSGVPGLTEAPVICRPERGRPGSLPDLTSADTQQ